MVQVQSTWFPLIGRNPQVFMPNIFEARDSDFGPAVILMYRGPGHTSHVTLPVVLGPAS